MHYAIDSAKFGPLFGAWRRRKARERRSGVRLEAFDIAALASDVGIPRESFRHVVAGYVLIGEIILINLANELNCEPKDLILRRNGLRELNNNQKSTKKKPPHICAGALGWD